MTRILVVDDEPMVVQVCAELLAGEGYHVRQACGGREALARLAELLEVRGRGDS